MSTAEKKKLIVNRIENIEEEWLIRAIEKLLDIDTDQPPHWHLPIVMEANEEYKANPTGAVKWKDLNKQWDNEL